MADTLWAQNKSFRQAASAGDLAATLASAARPRGAAPQPQRHHRTIFISDTHLGTRGCKAELLAEFLALNSCDTLYLIGDIIDGWRLKQRWFWRDSHTRVLQEILHKIDSGTRVIYVPGNHDEVFRPYCGRQFAGIEVMLETVHETADGKRLLIVHGDKFDGVIAFAPWLAHLGDWAYTTALQLSEWVHFVRRQLSLPYWSLSAFLKQKVKNAVEFICRFEEAVAHDAAAKGLDGVVCGHIHHATIKQIGAIAYHNDGDWVESCSALVEDGRGHMEILCWARLQERSLAGRGATTAGEAAIPA